MTSPQILFEHENEEISGSGSAKNKKQPFNAKYLNELAEIQNDVLFYIGESDCMKKKLSPVPFPCHIPVKLENFIVEIKREEQKKAIVSSAFG